MLAFAPALVWASGSFSALWTDSSSLSSFAHLMEMAFGSGIAYAVLIRTGQFQGSHIETYCTQRHQEVLEAKALLTAEDAALMAKVEIEGNKAKCDNYVAEYSKRIDKLSKRFAVAGVLVSIASVIILLIAGMWEPQVPNYLILTGALIAFAPVPVGLAWTYYLVQQAEAHITSEYQSFFVLVDVIRGKLKEETRRAMQEIDKRRAIKGPNIFQRLISGH